MDSANLLVIDKSTDCAQEINSLLRNSGISVRVDFADTTAAAEKILKEQAPALLIIGNPPENLSGFAAFVQSAQLRDIPAAFRISPAEPERLATVLSIDSCLLVNQEDDEQLIRLVKRVLGQAQQQSGQHGLQQQMEELENRYSLLLDSARDPIAYIHEGLHIYANRAYLESLGVDSFSSLEALSLLEFIKTEEVDLKKLLRDLGAGNYPKEPLTVEIQRPAGTAFHAELTFLPARFNDEPCTQMMVRERTAESELTEELDRLRRTDPLTRMANRKAFSSQLQEFIESGAPSETPSAIFYIEPDGIEELNNDLGIADTDEYIADLGEVIRNCISDGDTPARFGDHAFVVLVRRNEKGSLEETGQCIVSSYQDHIVDLGKRSLTATCSIGMATLGSLTESADEIIAHARQAFREATEKGNEMVRYRPKLTTVSSDEDDRHWVERIRYALNNHDFYSVQNSIVKLEGEGEGLFENLTYMRDEDGDSKPEDFFPAAERNDLASGIDRLVIPGLLKAISGGGDRHIIAISSNSIIDFSFPGWIQRQFEKEDVQPGQVILQLAASSILSSLKPARRLIHELQPLGCGFSMSEFDDERRTRQLLEHLDVSLVKLRSGLTKSLVSNTKNQAVIRKVVETADQYDAAVIADNVSDASDLAVLWQCGVKLVSGAFLQESSQVVGQ
jgi:diguanylate cyclase (GGDEF)-like protein